MKTTAVLCSVVLSLAGCALTPTQQKWAGIAAGVLVVGAIAAHDADSGKDLHEERVPTPNVVCSGENCR